jgi:orotate phosphoribosyltransferase
VLIFHAREARLGFTITSAWPQVKAKLAEEAALLLHRAQALLFGSFKLTSGLESPYYIDMRLIPSYPDLFERVCDAYCELIRAEVAEFDRVAGVPTAGIPFATLVAYKLRKPLIYVRKQLKLHGQLKTVEGVLKLGERVLLLDDLVSTGDSALKTVRAVREAGGVVEDVVVLIDREQGGRELLAEEGVRLHALLKVTEAARILYEGGLLSREGYEVILSYVEGLRVGPRPSG